MGARYSAMFQRTASTTLDVGSINSNATTPRRGAVYDLLFGSEASPADNVFLLECFRATTVGTADAVTEEALDPADAVSSAATVENHTVNGTSGGASLLSIPLNQRATFRWVAAPGGALVFPATANNGLAFKTPTATAVAISLGLHFEE